jgi:trans-aconitate methyltransferase
MRISLFIFCGLMIWSYGLNGVSRIWDAEAYLETSKYAKSLALEIIDQIAWSGKETVLDIGTGDGLNSSLIASKVPLGKVLGVDPSHEMIDFAKAHYPQERYPTLSFVIGGALDFRTEERFDIITSFTVLHLVLHFKNF